MLKPNHACALRKAVRTSFLEHHARDDDFATPNVRDGVLRNGRMNIGAAKVICKSPTRVSREDVDQYLNQYPKISKHEHQAPSLRRLLPRAQTMYVAAGTGAVPKPPPPMAPGAGPWAASLQSLTPLYSCYFNRKIHWAHLPRPPQKKNDHQSEPLPQHMDLKHYVQNFSACRLSRSGDRRKDLCWSSRSKSDLSGAHRLVLMGWLFGGLQRTTKKCTINNVLFW